MLHSFIQNNYATFIGCLCLMVFILTNHLLDTKNTGLFLTAIGCILLLVTVDALELWAASWAHPTAFRILMSAVGYSLRPAVAYLIICILEHKGIFLKRILFVLLMGNAVCSFSAFFCPLMFSYSADNLFIRGPLGYVPFVVSAILVACMLIFTIQKYYEGAYAESLIALIIVVICVISIIGEVVFHFKGLLNCSCTIAVVFYYLYLQTQQLKRDHLTNLRNRHCFYIDVKKKRDYVLVILSLDINNLKMVNDMKGHAAGDAMICSVVGSIKRSLPAGACAYRMGGDEFAILSRYQSEEQIDKMIQDIREDIEKEGNSCAIGAAVYSENSALERALQEADRAMYEDKRRIKEKLAKEAGK